MTKSTIPTRRTMLTAGAALAVVPLAAGVTTGVVSAATATDTPISRLWNTAEKLGQKLNDFAPQIAAATEEEGIPGWMRLSGEANIAGHERYSALVSILKAEPKSTADLAIMARTVLADDIQQGPKSWAAQRFAEATLSFHAAA